MKCMTFLETLQAESTEAEQLQHMLGLESGIMNEGYLSHISIFTLMSLLFLSNVFLEMNVGNQRWRGLIEAGQKYKP